MKSGYVLNPSEQMVAYIKGQVKDNSGYCIYCEKDGKKSSKCPKYCKPDNMDCPCGMYIKEDIYEGD